MPFCLEFGIDVLGGMCFGAFSAFLLALQVVLYMALMFVGNDVDATGLVTATAIALVFIAMMAFAIAITMMYGLVLYVVRQNRKPWRFFISHHKRAAGSFARLLKIQLPGLLFW